MYGFNFGRIKRAAIEEPIVDCVDNKNVVTDVCCILDLDLYTCKKEDLDFVTSYSLKMTKKDNVNALVSINRIC